MPTNEFVDEINRRLEKEWKKYIIGSRRNSEK
jgi:hypothetical protein